MMQNDSITNNSNSNKEEKRREEKESKRWRPKTKKKWEEERLNRLKAPSSVIFNTIYSLQMIGNSTDDKFINKVIWIKS